AGVYSLRVSLRQADGTLLPGQAAQGVFMVGQPVTASITTGTAFVPLGTSTVTTTITVANQPGSGNSAAPQVATGGIASPAVATSQSGQGGSTAVPALAGPVSSSPAGSSASPGGGTQAAAGANVTIHPFLNPPFSPP